ncbi:hypothetical protein SESBI_15835 [Sesbania bispinosa]|nr:hypothetical protein SESBI_15835 [Sesbania bispinosa]
MGSRRRGHLGFRGVFWYYQKVTVVTCLNPTIMGPWALPAGKEKEWALRCPKEDDRICSQGDLDENFFIPMYKTVFADLGVWMSLMWFELEVLGHLEVAPSQLHPNGWGFIRSFEILCHALGLELSSVVFFYFFRPLAVKESSDRYSWLPLRAGSGGKIFEAYYESYRNFKDKFVFVIPKAAGRESVYHEDERLIINPYWNTSFYERDSSAYTVDFKSLSKGEQKTATSIVKFVEKHGILDCMSVIKNGGLATRDLLVEMASCQQEKLAERKAKKALRDSQKRSEAFESETDAADHNSKRIKVTIPRPPPQHKQLDNQSKGSSSASLIGDKGPDGALTSTVAGEPGEVSASEKVDLNPQGDAVFCGAPCVLLTRSAFGVVSDSNNDFGAVPDLNLVRGCTRLENFVWDYTRLAWLFRGCSRLESRSGLYPTRMAFSGLCPT